MKTKDEIILAFDQASNISGYSVIQTNRLVSYGELSLKDIDKKHNGNTYYDEKVENVKQFLQKCIYFFNPTIVILEDVQQQTNVQTFKDLSYLQGVLKNYLFEMRIPYAILKPGEWRKELGIKGRKRAEQKENAQKYVKETYNLEVGEDSADSICIGTAGKQLMKKDKLTIFKEY